MKAGMLTALNFGFLTREDARLVQLGALAESYFRQDPTTAIMKVRQFAELLAKLIAAKSGVYLGERETFEDTLRRLAFERYLPREAADVFHAVRKLGNVAVHEARGTHADALTALKLARQLGIWFFRTYARQPNFNPGPFIPPPEPVDAAVALKAEIADLRQKVEDASGAAALAREDANRQARLHESLSERLTREAEERATWEALAGQIEAEKNEVANKLRALQAAAEAAPRSDSVATIERAEQAASRIDLDEAETRALIDAQLRDAEWDADTKRLRYADGSRPSKGANRAIAEWPTRNGPADYALFVGTTLIGLVEAKRKRKNVSAAIDQAERYASGIEPSAEFGNSGGPWGEHKVPFVFAANGRSYLRQVETEGGIWFRDTRRPSNHRRALVLWPTPDGLAAQLEIDRDAASASLRSQSFEFGFPLRPYQRAAIEAVESALEDDRRAMLIAMATGTGKTKLAIAMLYRLLSAKRFRRVCFVVDRSALGQQTEGEFSTTRIVSGKTFAEIFGLMGLGDTTPGPETKVHICTIQGLVRRVLFAADPGEAPPVDQYDIMVIDECHRGYLLDAEMSDAELTFRNEADYVSKYRRVLDHFDAVKIGLTATPALHTTDIFGPPIFRYGYREAVIDGFLIDHEPPVRIETALARSGIGFSEGEEVEYLATATGEVQLALLPDEIRFDVTAFNRNVVTREFNRVVADELARQIDPSLPGKTLIFAATDAHADIVVAELKRAMAAVYGEVDDAAIRKITGSVDRVGSLIRSFRNDVNPRIAVTVDLLTTGIDVPSITNLVFLRRVNSRILYEQMIGRATRQCPEIGKEVFRIFDAVDLYTNLQHLTDMKPVVVNPAISFEQLIRELAGAQAQAERDAIREQLIVKLRRRLKHLSPEARDRVEAVADETPEAVLARVQSVAGPDLSSWAKARAALGPILDWRSDDGTPRLVPISYHSDEVVAVTRGYGDAERPEDFLDGFTAFVRDNVNTIAALKVVVQRPRDLTRAQLRELRLELDKRGFSEANLRRAWSDAKNEEIAASIVGFVRQAAIGDPLVPYAERVQAAMRRIMASRTWTDPQRRWLKRIGDQVAAEIVVDRDALDRPPFDGDGGFTRLNKVFGGTLESVLADVNEELWKRTA